MKRFCRIVNGVVAEFFETDGDIAQMFHPDIQWVECAAAHVELGWVYEGGVFSAPPPDTPASECLACQPWQLRRALTQLGLRDVVEAAVAQSDPDLRDMWEYAVTIRRNHPMVAALSAALGKTAAEVDSVFELAVAIE